MKTDLVNRLKKIIEEEIGTVLSEREYRHGGVLDPENFDPVDPEVHVTGFGTMTRSSLRRDIAKRLVSLAKTAKQALDGSPGSYDKYNILNDELGPESQVIKLIKAELEIAQQLETLRSQGGRRTTPIPKQF